MISKEFNKFLRGAYVEKYWWVRVGDQGDYEQFDSLDDVGDYLSQLGIAPPYEQSTSYGFETDSYYGDNYISLYKGNAEAQPTDTLKKSHLLYLEKYYNKNHKYSSKITNKIAKEMGRATENAYDEIMNYEHIYTPIYNKSVSLAQKYPRDRAVMGLSKYIREFYSSNAVSTRQIAEIMIDEAIEYGKLPIVSLDILSDDFKDRSSNKKQSNKKMAEIGSPLRERNLRKVWEKSDSPNRQRLVDEADLRDYPEFSKLPSHTIADFDFDDFPEELRERYSNKKQAEVLKGFGDGNMILSDFIKEINNLRLKSRGGWYQWVGSVEGKEIKLKGYKTWLQIYKVDGIDYSGGMDIGVKEFKNTLELPFKKIVSRKKQAGGGAGIEFKVSRVYGIADIDLVNELIKPVDTDPIDSFDAEGYQDGMRNVKGSLVIPEIGFSIEDHIAIVETALEVLGRYNLQEIKELVDFENTESYLEIRGLDFKGMISKGWVRGDYGKGDVINLQGTAEVELHFNGDYFNLGEFDAELSLIATEEFGYFYQDVFRFDGEGDWEEEDYYLWQEDLKNNYGV